MLMLPGWGVGKSVWKKVVLFLSEHFQIEFCEWHGIEDAEGYMAKVCGLIEKEEGKLCLMGWSLGSLLAINAVCKYSDRIEKLILISGTSKFSRDKMTQYPWGWPEAVIQKMKTALNKDIGKTMFSFYCNMFCKEEIENGGFEEFVKTVSAENHKNKRELEAGLDLLIYEDTRALLADINVPMLLIHGEKDTICPVEAAQFILSEVKGKAVLNIMAGVGHVPFYTAADEFSNIIKAFIE